MSEQSKPVAAAAAEKTVTGNAPATTDALRTPVETKKKKRKYSRGLRSGQEIERGITRAASALGDAVSSAFGSYKKRSRKSSLKKRDGAVKDAIENWTKAGSKGMKEAADAPYQMVKAVNSNKASKQIRDAVKMFSPPMFR